MEGKKRWGNREFWGVGYEYDPQWVLTPKQKQLQEKLIELCRTTLRENAVRSDETYEFPRENLNALATLGILGATVPEELGGLGESHVCAVMLVETIARYGCPSTALVYVMHLGAVASALLRYHNNDTLKDLLRRLDKDRLVGTLIYSDPATGGHFWYPVSSKCWRTETGHYRTLKYASWTTSAGHADWYMAQVISPGFDGDYMNSSIFLFMKDEVRASTDEWSSLGLHGNQSGANVSEGLLTPDRLVGPIGDGVICLGEIIDTYAVLMLAVCWNGVSMACIDLAKKHVTSKGHADVGHRVCDYPTIQDYFGECMSSTNSARLMSFSVARGMDLATNNGDWSMYEDLTAMPRAAFEPWIWQVKFETAKNVSMVTEKMLHACGGSGYNTSLGLERIFRDGKAGWVMGPSNEVLRQWVGKTVLMGKEALDLWSQKVDQRNLNTELKKLTKDQKSELVERLKYELSLEDEGRQETHRPHNDIYFDDPFNTEPARIPDDIQKEHVVLHPTNDTELKLTSIVPLTADGKIVRMVFDFPPDRRHLGTFPGQYIEIRMPANGKTVGRYISPISTPDGTDSLEMVIRYENQGHLARFLRSLQIGQHVAFRGPCGGFEFEPNKLDHVVLLCSGIGITPGLQIIRGVVNNKTDRTKVTLLYQSVDREHLLFQSELDNASSDPRVRVTCILQDPDGEWDGPVGTMGLSFLKENLNGYNGLKNCKIIICGGTNMITSCMEGLHRLRYKSEQIFIYGPFGAELVRMSFGRSAKLTTQRS